ncbi:hypothetical protein T02_7799 [Trichinella nativa]|uniref:Uncharacterized protein n=1 Tax=Trichinella nativa TaxID=6335 RepID=A0A0V1LUQ9_9BILA|nr:hypothetical protein T02_7799 [Trichinella nativa]
MPSYVKLELHNYTTSIAKNNDVRLTENFQQIEPLQLIRVESSVRKFVVMASSTFSFSWWDGRQSVACRAAVRIAHSAVISLYEVCMLHILSLESQQLLTTVTTDLSCHLTMYTFPSQEQSYKFLRSFMSSLFDVNISEAVPLRFSRTVPVARTLRSDNFFNVSELVKKLSKYIS